MTKYRITSEERYPVYDLADDLDDEDWYTIELTDEERADYDAACTKWDAWQGRFDEIAETRYAELDYARRQTSVPLPPGVARQVLSPPEVQR